MIDDSLGNLPDDELLQMFRDDNPNGLEALMAKRSMLLLGIAFSKCNGNHGIAEEAVHLTFSQLAENPFLVKTSFMGWAKYTVKNNVRFLLNKQKRYNRTIDPEIGHQFSSSSPDPYESLQRKELKEHILKIVLSLPKESQEILKLFYEQEMSTQEAADKLGMLQNTYIVKKTRILTEIRRRLLDEGLINE